MRTFIIKSLLSIVAISGIALFLLVSCTTQQNGRSSSGSTLSPNYVVTDASAQAALEKVKGKVLILPEALQGWKLQSVQIPSDEEGSPFLFTYINGSRIISLAQVHGEKLSFQPVGTVVSTTNGMVKIRGGRDAFYTETITEKSQTIELVWKEDDLTVSLLSEQLDLDTMIAIAELLSYSN